MDTRLLTIFVAAAETENFRLAAEQLGIAPPAVSQRIQQLEDLLGFPVFHRIHRGVELTAAGRSMLAEAREVLARTEHAIETAKSIRRGEVGELKIGFGTSVMAEEQLPLLIKRYLSKYPGIKIEFFDGNTMAELVAAAEAQEVDIIFIRSPILSLTPNLRVSPFSQSEMHVSLALGHPLAARRSISIREIAEENLIMMVDPVSMGMSHRILSLFEEAGVYPKVGIRTSNITTIVRLIAAGVGIGMLPSGIPAAFNNIIGIPIDAAEATSDAVMIYKRGSLALHVQNFIQMAMEQVRVSSKP
jgi:DNA-binding transcriptional LysR family regulator